MCAADNNDQHVCELNGCGDCCYERGADCEAPEAGISHLPMLFQPALLNIRGVRLTFDSVASDGNEQVSMLCHFVVPQCTKGRFRIDLTARSGGQVIFREIHFLSSEMYTCGVLQNDNDGGPVLPPPVLGCTDRDAQVN
jgi:hypothetical protein